MIAMAITPPVMTFLAMPLVVALRHVDERVHGLDA
jgi:hypothetical protein